MIYIWGSAPPVSGRYWVPGPLFSAGLPGVLGLRLRFVFVVMLPTFYYYYFLLLLLSTSTFYFYFLLFTSTFYFYFLLLTSYFYFYYFLLLLLPRTARKASDDYYYHPLLLRLRSHFGFSLWLQHPEGIHLSLGLLALWRLEATSVIITSCCFL